MCVRVLIFPYDDCGLQITFLIFMQVKLIESWEWCDKSKNWMKVRTFWRRLYISKVGDHGRGWSKSTFSIASTPRCRGGRYSIPWIAPFYPWSLPYQVPFFWVFGMTRPGIEPQTPGPLANTQLISPMDRFYTYIKHQMKRCLLISLCLSHY